VLRISRQITGSVIVHRYLRRTLFDFSGCTPQAEQSRRCPNEARFSAWTKVYNGIPPGEPNASWVSSIRLSSRDFCVMCKDPASICVPADCVRACVHAQHPSPAVWRYVTTGIRSFEPAAPTRDEKTLGRCARWYSWHCSTIIIITRRCWPSRRGLVISQLSRARKRLS
jgi:hypothetical protein